MGDISPPLDSSNPNQQISPQDKQYPRAAKLCSHVVLSFGHGIVLRLKPGKSLVLNGPVRQDRIWISLTQSDICRYFNKI